MGTVKSTQNEVIPNTELCTAAMSVKKAVVTICVPVLFLKAFLKDQLTPQSLGYLPSDTATVLSSAQDGIICAKGTWVW